MQAIWGARIAQPAIAAIAIVTFLATTSEAQTLKREPPAGALRSGERVLVDDRSCPKGQIKEVIGGRDLGGSSAGQRRQRRCISR